MTNNQHCTPQIASIFYKVVYLSANAPDPCVHSFGHVAIFCTGTYDLILNLEKLFPGSSRFAVWFLSWLG